jgi:hypothetical protein
MMDIGIRYAGTRYTVVRHGGMQISPGYTTACVSIGKEWFCRVSADAQNWGSIANSIVKGHLA